MLSDHCCHLYRLLLLDHYLLLLLVWCLLIGIFTSCTLWIDFDYSVLFAVVNDYLLDLLSPYSTIQQQYNDQYLCYRGL